MTMMMNIKTGKLAVSVCFSIIFSLFLSVGNAATLYKWIDADGNVVYQDTPPPENVEFEESVVDAPGLPITEDTGKKIEEAALATPVSLYTVPICDSCDLVRLFLERNSIPFAEKDVRNNPDTQSELEQLAGSLSVPTLMIGNTILDGFSRRAITSALQEAGFPISEAEQDNATKPSDEQTDVAEPVAEISGNTTN